MNIGSRKKVIISIKKINYCTKSIFFIGMSNFVCKFIVILTNERILTRVFFPLTNTHTHLFTRRDQTVSVYYFPTAEDDEEGPTFKERLLACVMKGIDIFCVWDCCWLWLEFQKYVALLVFDPFVELFITLCIVVNTLFMALDHHDMDRDMEKALKSGNYVSRYQISNI